MDILGSDLRAAAARADNQHGVVGKRRTRGMIDSDRVETWIDRLDS